MLFTSVHDTLVCSVWRSLVLQLTTPLPLLWTCCIRGQCYLLPSSLPHSLPSSSPPLLPSSPPPLTPSSSSSGPAQPDGGGRRLRPVWAAFPLLPSLPPHLTPSPSSSGPAQPDGGGQRLRPVWAAFPFSPLLPSLLPSLPSSLPPPLPVDLLSLTVAVDAFDQFELRAQNDTLMDVVAAINCVTSMYESVAEDHPNIFSLPLTVDLILNWLVNTFDRSVESPSRPMISLRMTHLGHLAPYHLLGRYLYLILWCSKM